MADNVTPIIGISGIAFLVFMLTNAFWFSREERRNLDIRRHLRDNIREKLQANVALSTADILNIGRGLGSSRDVSIEVIYELLADAKEEKEVKEIKALIDDILKKEPFEDVPEEVKSSMIRLAELCSGAQNESDKNLLIPIRRALADYKVMQKDHDIIRARNKVSYVIAIISFCVGIIGLILAFRTPNRAYIKETIDTSLKREIEKLLPQKRGETMRYPLGEPSQPRLNPKNRLSHVFLRRPELELRRIFYANETGVYSRSGLFEAGGHALGHRTDGSHT